MGWIAYAAAWAAAALFWSMASAVGAGLSPLATLPWGLLAMGVAGAMGIGVWRLTGRVPWDWRARSFYAAHAAALPIYAFVYTTALVWPDLLRGRFSAAAAGLFDSPVLGWNLLMGSWLYLIVAGLSYAVRAHRRLRAEEAAAAEARLLAQQAQIVALRAQINPHFLFNALHSVGALVTSDPARADQALESLGDLLRYALGSEDEVLFAQEWRFTQDYLAFEGLRLGDRLRVDADIGADAMTVMVPPLILQPLVENAVRHGIADRPEGGRVGLVARVAGSRLRLRVTDDGPGDGQCDAQGDGQRGGGAAGDGLGLASVRRRLAALYGSRATFDVERAASGFTVTIELPVDEPDGLDSAA